MNYINSKLKSKFGPFLLAGATVLVLVAALLVSGTFSRNVFAASAGAGSVSKTVTLPTNTTTPAAKGATTPPNFQKSVPTPTNLAAPTAEPVDESGNKGFVICGNTVDTPCNITHLFRTLIIIINYLITMAGLVAVLFIVIAGVQMIIAAGSFGGETNQAQLTTAKKKLTSAIVGVVLVAVAFVLMNTLLAGSLNIGIKNGALILTNPRAYINQDQTPPSETGN